LTNDHVINARAIVAKAAVGAPPPWAPGTGQITPLRAAEPRVLQPARRDMARPWFCGPKVGARKFSLFGHQIIGDPAGTFVYPPTYTDGPLAPAGPAVAAALYSAVDAAVVTLDDWGWGYGHYRFFGARGWQCGVDGIGAIYGVDAAVTVIPGQAVYKTGISTGTTRGRVSATNQDAWIGPTIPHGFGAAGGAERMVRQITIRPERWISTADWFRRAYYQIRLAIFNTVGILAPVAPVIVEHYRPFSVGGDSGSIIVRADALGRWIAFAHLHAGNLDGTNTIASPIHEVEAAMNIQICSATTTRLGVLDPCGCAAGGAHAWTGANFAPPGPDPPGFFPLLHWRSV